MSCSTEVKAVNSAAPARFEAQAYVAAMRSKTAIHSRVLSMLSAPPCLSFAECRPRRVKCRFDKLEITQPKLAE